MRAALIIGLCLVASVAVGGSYYVRVTASQVDGLGTAATLDVGTGANDVVQLDGTGKLPAVDGSALTGVSADLSTALDALGATTPGADLLPYYTSSIGAGTTTLTAAGRALLDDVDASVQRSTLGLGSAATLTAGTSANNVVQLDGSGKLPAVDGSALTGLSSGAYAADSWDVVWEAADGATGWTTSGTSTTNGIATTNGKSAWTVTTASSNSAYAYRTLASPAPDNSFEIRALVYITAQMTASDPNGWFMFCAFGKLIRVVISSTGVATYTGAGGSSPTTVSGAPLGRWMTVTLRVTSPEVDQSSPTTSGVTGEIWVGEVYIGTTQVGLGVSAGGSTYEANGAFTVGTTTSTSTAAVAWVAYREGINAAPPSYTYHGLGYAPDVAAP